MSKKIKWGIISTAKIAIDHVIPALQALDDCEVAGIASRSPEKAQDVASQMNIPKSYGSYAEMFDDPEIDVVYNPLPNNLHIPVSKQAIKSGKHVLCEKPVAMTEKEAEQLRETPAGICFMEAFMVRFHSQWHEALKIVQSGELGEVRAIQTFFSFFKDDPENIRNNPVTGGGAVYDIGCYANVTSKYIFGNKPERVVTVSDIDPEFNVDRLTSGIFDFGGGRHLTFSVSTQLVLYQRVNILGTKARLEVLIPFNPVGGQPTKILLDDGKDLSGSKIKTIEIPACNHYSLECAAMNQAIRKEEELKYSIEDAIENAHILDAIFRSAKSNSWENIK